MFLKKVVQTGPPYSARAHVRTRFPYLRNGGTECAEIWFVARDLLASHFTQTKRGVLTFVRAHVRTLFRISGIAGRISLQFFFAVLEGES